MKGKLSEEQAIEKATAEDFLSVYNMQCGSSYRIVELGDAPDVRCEDGGPGHRLNLEISVLEDLPGEARHRLGRGPKPGGRWGTGARSFRDDTIEQMIERLREKLRNRYGPDTALVVRQLAPIWDRHDWERYLPEIPWSQIGYRPETFDRGIWVLCIKTLGIFSPDGLIRSGYDDILRIDPSLSTAGF